MQIGINLIKNESRLSFFVRAAELDRGLLRALFPIFIQIKTRAKFLVWCFFKIWLPFVHYRPPGSNIAPTSFETNFEKINMSGFVHFQKVF